MEIIAYTPTIDEVPPNTVDTFIKGMDTRCVYTKSLHELFMYNPKVVVKNVGNEPVEAIRIETRMMKGIIDRTETPPEKLRQPTPFVLRQGEKEDYVLSQKLMPGQCLLVPVTRGVLGQMAQAQDPAAADRKHWITVGFRSYGRIVGGSTFDAVEPSKIVIMPFMWLPAGFPEDKCQKTLDTMKPEPELVSADLKWRGTVGKPIDLK